MGTRKGAIKAAMARCAHAICPVKRCICACQGVLHGTHIRHTPQVIHLIWEGWLRN